jgi:hypothetical protein
MKPLLLALLALSAAAQTPDIREIMQRVAANQAKSEDSRGQFVYLQKQTVRLGQTNGKLAREERREYRMIPSANGVRKELVSLKGRFEERGQEVQFEQSVKEHEGVRRDTMDADLARDLSEDLTGDSHSRDGFAHDLFPLTSEEQKKYRFRLAGSEVHHGRSVYRVAFDPNNQGEWKGEALIDAAEFQPVSISTTLARHVPLVVRTVFGTNVKGLGFAVSYQKFDGGVWFPVSYGGEFELRAVFFYKRVISVSMTNSDFRRADVTSDITYSNDAK